MTTNFKEKEKERVIGSIDGENTTQKRFHAQRQSLENSKCIFCTKGVAMGQLH